MIAAWLRTFFFAVAVLVTRDHDIISNFSFDFDSYSIGLCLPVSHHFSGNLSNFDHRHVISFFPLGLNIVVLSSVHLTGV